MSKNSRFTLCALCAAAAAGATTGYAQIDPEPRQLLHLGGNQSLKDDGPRAIYAFYYWNIPQFPTTNQTLRIVIAPGYVDSELGFNHLLGPNTDFAVGAFGGLFANSYEEVRDGHYYKSQSFDGNGGGVSLNVYHLFNPAGMIPLNGVLRGDMDYHAFDTRDTTASTFVLPKDQPFFHLRAGLRWGGKEPVLGPRLAMEVSGWYTLEQRTDSGNYGFGGDRRLKPTSHQFLEHAAIHYTTPVNQNYIVLGITAGQVIDADRFSAYRVGGALPFTGEFPLYLPGYFYEELSTEAFGLLYGSYGVPFGPNKEWNVTAGGAMSVDSYISGFDQPGNFNSGVGFGGGYTAPSRAWRTEVGFGYGINAIRDSQRGGYNIAIVFQYNFGKKEFASDEAFEQLEKARAPIK